MQISTSSIETHNRLQLPQQQPAVQFTNYYQRWYKIDTMFDKAAKRLVRMQLFAIFILLANNWLLFALSIPKSSPYKDNQLTLDQKYLAIFYLTLGSVTINFLVQLIKWLFQQFDQNFYLPLMSISKQLGHLCLDQPIQRVTCGDFVSQRYYIFRRDEPITNQQQPEDPSICSFDVYWLAFRLGIHKYFCLYIHSIIKLPYFMCALIIIVKIVKILFQLQQQTITFSDQLRSKFIIYIFIEILFNVSFVLKLLAVVLISSVRISESMNGYYQHEREVRQRVRRIQNQPQGSTSSRDQIEIQNNGNVIIKSSLQCIICLLKLNNGRLIKILPCHNDHSFHQDCIDAWAQRNPVCPVCREPIPINRNVRNYFYFW